MMNTASATFEGQIFSAEIPELGDKARLQMSAIHHGGPVKLVMPR